MSRFRLAPAMCAATMIAALALSVAAQAPVDLGKRNARSKYTLGHVFAAQEFPDGRVVASDTKEQVFRLVDFAKGDVGLIGKQGDDSDTYRTSSVIVRLPGDSLGLYDPAGRKMLHVTPQATIARFVPLPTISNGRRIGTLLGADPNGSLYFTLPEQRDSVTKGRSGVAGVTRFSVGADADEPQATIRMRRADQTRAHRHDAVLLPRRRCRPRRRGLDCARRLPTPIRSSGSRNGPGNRAHGCTGVHTNRDQ